MFALRRASRSASSTIERKRPHSPAGSVGCRWPVRPVSSGSASPAGKSSPAGDAQPSKPAAAAQPPPDARARAAADAKPRADATPPTQAAASPPPNPRGFFRRMLRRILAAGLLAAGGTGAYVAYRTQKDEEAQQAGVLARPEQWEIEALRLLPTRVVSAACGVVASAELPPPVREPLFRSYAALFGADLSEIGVPLDSFPTLNAFFSRPLRPGARPIADAELVSPVDGIITHFGRASSDDEIEQVKGLSYSRSELLGGGLGGLSHPPSGTQPEPAAGGWRESFRARRPLLIGRRGGSAAPAPSGPRPWYHCTIYLGPGTYHRVHSPADWSIRHARHFPGYLIPVHPFFSRYVPHLFAMNERLVAAGQWRHGGIAVAAIGSMGVGNISASFDPTEVPTKRLGDPLPSYPPPRLGGPFHETTYPPDSLQAARGDEIAAFRMGSTVVLCFQAPPEFEFRVRAGQRVRVGQRLGTL